MPTGGSSQRELELADENKELKQEVSELRVENDELVLLAQRHEEVLEKVLDGLRKYAVCFLRVPCGGASLTGWVQNEHSIATINIHSSYTNQLASERTQNAALRQREMDNSARLTKLSGLLREAYQQETVLEPDIVIEQLKAENEALRQALGVEDLEGEGEGEGGI